jgi:hypothetical protein
MINDDRNLAGLILISPALAVLALLGRRQEARSWFVVYEVDVGILYDRMLTR